MSIVRRLSDSIEELPDQLPCCGKVSSSKPFAPMHRHITAVAVSSASE
jgi:hypothetical protein